jgi:hypothetical protein
MTTSAAALPVLPLGADIRSITERLNALIRWFNRPDLLIPTYAADTGTGAAYVIAPSSDIKVYEVGQIYAFTAAHANTSANPTLAVQGLAAGTIMRINGTPLSLGDIPAGPVAVICTSTTPAFALVSPYNNVGATTFLGSNIALNNASNYFNGPNTGSLGANGQAWLIMATAQVDDTAGPASVAVGIFNGATNLAESAVTTAGAFYEGCISIAVVVVLTAATTFTLRAKGLSTTSRLLTSNGVSSFANISTSITAVRLA